MNRVLGACVDIIRKLEMLRRADAEEDLYSGFNEDAHPAFDTRTLQIDEGFQQAVQSSHGMRLSSNFRLMTARGNTAMRRGDELYFVVRRIQKSVEPQFADTNSSHCEH